MTQEEIQRRIGYLLGQIDALQKDSASLKKNIDELEEGGADASSLIGKWESMLSDCFSLVKSNLAKVNPNSGFNLYYLEQINAILSGKEATEIGDCLSAIKSDSTKKIGEFEEKVKSNNVRIQQFQNEISELRAMQLVEVE